jgi:hypothetical protein
MIQISAKLFFKQRKFTLLCCNFTHGSSRRFLFCDVVELENPFEK